MYKDGYCRYNERIRIYFKIRRSTKRFVFFECMYKQDLVLNNLQRLICHKIQTNKQFILKSFLSFSLFHPVFQLQSLTPIPKMTILNINI